MHCANCGTALGNLEDAHAWLGRPACKRCFKHLSAACPSNERRFWKPLSIVLGVVVVAQAVGLAVGLHRAARANLAADVARVAAVPFRAEMRPVNENPLEVGVAPPPPPPPAEVTGEGGANARPPQALAPAAAAPAEADVAGPSRSDVVAMLRADRTWYWHWEQRDRNNRFHFAQDADGTIRTVGEGGAPVVLERRWVLSLAGHYFIPVDDHTIRGFYAPTGRPAGAFTD